MAKVLALCEYPGTKIKMTVLFIFLITPIALNKKD
jgi:hypothetical protein